jgi:hypothetical protein
MIASIRTATCLAAAGQRDQRETVSHLQVSPVHLTLPLNSSSSFWIRTLLFTFTYTYFCYIYIFWFIPYSFTALKIIFDVVPALQNVARFILVNTGWFKLRYNKNFEMLKINESQREKWLRKGGLVTEND